MNEEYWNIKATEVRQFFLFHRKFRSVPGFFPTLQVYLLFHTALLSLILHILTAQLHLFKSCVIFYLNKNIKESKWGFHYFVIVNYLSLSRQSISFPDSPFCGDWVRVASPSPINVAPSYFSLPGLQLSPPSCLYCISYHGTSIVS